MHDKYKHEDSFARKSALNKKIHLEKVRVHNKRTLFIKEIAGVLAFVTVAFGTVGMVKAMVDDYSRKKHPDLNKSHSDSYDGIVPSTVAANNLEQHIEHETEKQEQPNNERYKELEESKEEAIFEIATSEDEKVTEYLNSERGNLIHRYSSDYGIDANIVAAICEQESSLNHEQHTPGGAFYNGYGVGAMQLESPAGEKITAYNYNTGNYDTIYETMDNACDESTNIQIGCMVLQNNLRHYDGNLAYAIQAYNYGQGMMDLIINRMQKDGVDTNDYNMLLKYIDDVHNNPSKYIDGWTENKYGDGKYLKHVLSHCPTKNVVCKDGDKEIKINLETMQISNQNSKVR